jgi:hypothetical protein
MSKEIVPNGIICGPYGTNGHLNRATPLAQSRLAVGRGLFAGSGPVLADRQSYATLFGMVLREATMVALTRVFQLLGILALNMLPLIALTKRPPKGQASQPMGH